MNTKAGHPAPNFRNIGAPNPYLPTVNRACQRCSRKKIKCDMRRPCCGLCKRLGVACTFPVRQKPGWTSACSARRNENPLNANRGVDVNALPKHSNDGGLCDSVPASLFRVLDANAHLEELREYGRAESRADASAKAHIHPSPTSELGSSVDSENARADELNGWDMPDEVALEVIDHYFADVQPWLSILHRPSFLEEYTVTTAHSEERLRHAADLSQAEVFMLNGVFSLAARFSAHPFFASTPAPQRGQKFARSASVIKDAMIAASEEPTLHFVKGCVFLAYHDITAGELASGSVLTSLCVHFAYDLELDMVDAKHINEDGSSGEELRDVDAWVRREELRRLWWAVWELDAFVATLSRQTFKINKSSEMKVFLPVSNEHWYSRQPLPSSILDHRLATAWKSLEGSPNQSPHAWCLVAKQVKSLGAIAAGRQHTPMTPESINEFESAVCCLELILPVEFQIQSLYLHRANFVDGLWIVSTHLMILACETLLARMQSSNSASANGFELSPRAPRLKSYVKHITNVWSPEYIPLTSPILSCCLVIPATLNSQLPETAPTCLEVSTLVLSHMARCWKLGQDVIRLLAAIQEGLNQQSQGLLSQEREMAKRFSILLPVSPRASSTTMTITSNEATSITAAAQDTPSSADVIQPDQQPQMRNFDLEDVWDMDSFDWLFDWGDLGEPWAVV